MSNRVNGETSSLLDTWRIINLMRVLGAVLGWVLVAAVQPNKDFTAREPGLHPFVVVVVVVVL